MGEVTCSEVEKIPREDHSPRYVRQMAALESLSSWCKWVTSILMACIGAIASMLLGVWQGAAALSAVAKVALFVAMGTFGLAIALAAYILFGLPDIIEQLPRSRSSSINEMKSPFLSHDLLWAQRRLFVALGVGVAFSVAGVGLATFL